MKWQQLSTFEQDAVMMVLAGVFVTLGVDELLAAEWYDAGYIKLTNTCNTLLILMPSTPGSTEFEELAEVRYDKTE